MKTIYDVPIIFKRVDKWLDHKRFNFSSQNDRYIVKKVIFDIAFKEGQEYAELFGRNDLQAIRMQMEPWSSNGALNLAWSISQTI